jgi:tRNA-splicing ligase RtcB
MSRRLRKLDDCRFEVAKSGGMRVPGRIYASEAMVSKIERERVAEQVANVAHLPGIVDASLAMPDCHWGYGAPVGGVAAMDAKTGVVSPGMVGYDISCGVRLVRSNLTAGEMQGRKESLLDALHATVASGVGKGGRLKVAKPDMKRVFERGARWAVEQGYGEREDLDAVEDAGAVEGAEPDSVSDRALERGRVQVGTLGSGNHFLELQEVDAVYDPVAAEAFGLFERQFVVMIHTGSRGCGYQICTDSLKLMGAAGRRYGIALPDRQLACAPIDSPEGRAYIGAMNAGSNYARANRQVITHLLREAAMRALEISPADLGMGVVYDVSHNIAKFERHKVRGEERTLCVHRKGATRAFPAGHPDVPEPYRGVGQPVLVPGSMGTHSYVLRGTETAMLETFGTVCHGAGRMMSRTQAAKRIRGDELAKELERGGVSARTDSWRGFAEEAPFAYKDVSEVVAVCERAGLAKKVARLRPIGVLKG